MDWGGLVYIEAFLEWVMVEMVVFWGFEGRGEGSRIVVSSFSRKESCCSSLSSLLSSTLLSSSSSGSRVVVSVRSGGACGWTSGVERALFAALRSKMQLSR